MNRAQRRAGWLARHRHANSREMGGPRDGGAAGPAAVRLHIDELVLHGFAASDRYAIGDAVHQELTRLLTQHGVPPWLARSGETERIDAGSFAITAGARPQVIGARVARAVHGGMKS